MRKGIIYLLMGIFLLFVAENSHSLDLRTDGNNQSVLLHLFSISKKFHLNQSFTKHASKHIADSVDFTEETGCNIANPYTFAVVCCFAGLLYLWTLAAGADRKIKFRDSQVFCAVRRFILLRSIRI